MEYVIVYLIVAAVMLVLLVAMDECLKPTPRLKPFEAVSVSVIWPITLLVLFGSALGNIVRKVMNW